MTMRSKGNSKSIGAAIAAMTALPSKALEPCALMKMMRKMTIAAMTALPSKALEPCALMKMMRKMTIAAMSVMGAMGSAGGATAMCSLRSC
jgi:hypothetical protein